MSRELVSKRMDHSKTCEIIEGTDADEAIAFLNILYTVSDTREFTQWLVEFHKIRDISPLLNGYKFFITTSLRAFLNSFIMHDPFRLKDDEISYRAEFFGIKLERLPNSCEKIIFQKNIWQMNKKVLKIQNWNSLNVKKELMLLFEMYEHIQKNLATSKNFSTADAVMYLSMFYSYLLLSDTSLGRPKGYFHPFFQTMPKTEYLNKAFDGYAYTLEFFWYKVLGREKFLESCTKDLHRSNEVNPNQYDLMTVEVDEEDLLQEVEYSPTDIKKQKLQLQIISKWRSIDQFFNKIRKEIIWPLEKKIEYKFGIFDTGLVKINKFEKSLLNVFLDKSNLDEPKYMTNNDIKSIKERLAVEFLWYDVDVLNADEANLQFNGMFAFNIFLTGYVTSLEENGSDDLISVIKIIHPQKHDNSNYYSLAIKVNSLGLFTDTSGWIVFYNALVDSPGTGGRYRDLCFECIEKFKKKSRIKLTEITIDKKIFWEFLETKKIKLNETELSIGYKQISSTMAAMKGKLFEYVFQKYCLDSEEYERVYGDTILFNQQIDCICLKKNSIDVFECKIRYHESQFQSYIKQIKRIKQAVEKTYSKNITPVFVTYFPMRAEDITNLEDEKIKVIHNFRNKISNHGIFSERKKITQLLEFDLKKEFYKRKDDDWLAY